MPTRRQFLRNSLLTGAGVSVGLNACASRRILGANERVNIASIGVNGRGAGLTEFFAKAQHCHIHSVCDVDTRAHAKVQQAIAEAGYARPAGEQDFRRVLDDKDIDAVVIATPDHWHAPMAILALDAGKDVYLEKPCSHNPAEGDMLVAKIEKTGGKVQMGNQTRSSASIAAVVDEIRQGLIGEAYAAKAWYANTRGPIGDHRKEAVPEWLDWELWQGPAPRTEFDHLYVHYHWHWFWPYGTGELLNNGTHEIDMCRWALGVDYPTKVTSTGGRYHFDDAWEAYDTQTVGYEYGDGKTINWEGRSCNGMQFWNRGRGALIHGTTGSVILNRDGFVEYDLQGKEVRNVREAGKTVSMDIRGGGTLDDNHIANFIGAIREDTPLNSPIVDANVSVTTCHLGNIAQRTGGTLTIDPTTGKPREQDALALWGRDYATGWEPKV